MTVPEPLDAILVVLVRGGMGDVLVSSPVLDALHRRWPSSRIDMLVRAGAADMVAAHPALHDVLTIGNGELDTKEGFRRMLGEVRQRRYGLGMVLWSQASEAWLLWRAGIPVRVGQAGRLTYSWTYTHRVRVRSEHGDSTSHWVECQLDYARAVGAPLDDPSPRLYLRDDARAAAVAAAAAAHLPERYAVLHVGRGTPLTPARIPTAPFAAIGDAVARHLGVPIALTGGAAESEVVAAVAEQMREPHVNMCGRLGVAPLGALLERAVVVVANDSGPMHMAAGTGTPTVGIFAMEKDLPRRWGPWGGEIVRPSSFRCLATCRKETCPSMVCYEDVAPETVVAAVRRALEARETTATQNS